MKQGALFPEYELKEEPCSGVVNVASVPHRSPFRYPGGKTWFVPTFRAWISSMERKPDILVEPFAGGGIISLTALFENLVDNVVMVEMDEDVAAVWQTINEGNAIWLAEKIVNFDLTRDNVLKELNKKYKDPRYKAFQTILKNRTFHGGILAEGSGLIKHGENGRGLKSRWYPQTIAKRLRRLDMVASRINFICGDGIETIKKFRNRKYSAFFIDPPYTAGGKNAGRRLYKYFEIDHERLFDECKMLKGSFLMTYDTSEEVKDMAERRGFDMRLTAMMNTHHAKLKELVISRDLSWMRDAHTP